MLADRAIFEFAATQGITEHCIVDIPIALPEPAGPMVVELINDRHIANVGTGADSSNVRCSLNLAVQQINLLINEVRLVAANPQDALAPAITLHQPRVRKRSHHDVGILVTDRDICSDQITPDLIEVGHLILWWLVAVCRCDAAQQGIRPVLITFGSKIVAANRHRNQRPVAVAANACSTYLGGDLADHCARTGNKNRLGVELLGETGTRGLVKFALAGTRTESGRVAEGMGRGPVVVIARRVAMDATARAVGIAKRHDALNGWLR